MATLSACCRWVMFYEGVGPDNRRSISMAVSSDGRGGWRRLGRPILEAGPQGAWDGGGVGAPCPVSMAGRVLRPMLYQPYARTCHRVPSARADGPYMRCLPGRSIVVLECCLNDLSSMSSHGKRCQACRPGRVTGRRPIAACRRAVARVLPWPEQRWRRSHRDRGGDHRQGGPRRVRGRALRLQAAAMRAVTLCWEAPHDTGAVREFSWMHAGAGWRKPGTGVQHSCCCHVRCWKRMCVG